jgi:hypothetical protein
MAQMKPLKIEPTAPPPTTMQKILDVVERVGNGGRTSSGCRRDRS